MPAHWHTRLIALALTDTRSYTSADQLSIVVASRQCLQVLTQPSQTHRNSLERFSRSFPPFFCARKFVASKRSQQPQAAALDEQPSTIPDAVDAVSFCMMTNAAAVEAAVESAAAASAARFKEWGQPFSWANDTAVDVSD